MENLRQLPILAEYDSQSAYKLSDTIKNLGEDTETEHKRVEQIEGFIDETKATRAKRMEQANALKEALRHHEEAVIDLTSILTKQASMLNDVHLNIKDLEERKEAAMWLSNTKNPNKPFVKEKIESVREFLDLEAPEKVDMLTSLVAVATLYKLENYGIGNRSGVYKKVQTGKGNASTNELQLRIKRLLEFDVESFPVDRAHTPSFNRARGALSHATNGSGIAVQLEPANQSFGESEEEVRKMRLRILELESLVKNQLRVCRVLSHLRNTYLLTIRRPLYIGRIDQ